MRMRSRESWGEALAVTLWLTLVSFGGALAAVMVARYLGWVG